MAMSVHLTNCMLPQHKSENFQNDKMNKSIQLVRPNDGLYNPYEMTKWNSRWQCLSIWPIVCCLSTKSEIFPNDKMNKSIQLVRPNDGLYHPYEMTNWNSGWQCQSIWPIVSCLSTIQNFFQMTKWTNRFIWSDQMTDCTIRNVGLYNPYEMTKWNSGWQCPSIWPKLYAVSAQIRNFSKWQNEQIDSVGQTKWRIVQSVRNDKMK